ncbi:hypothetical protein Pla86_46000 [Planctomycetes bacterium Pla86]|uniref:Uncharacterized protein n=1 Tax=Engelhardtia mirabilis TaxID=2528011 RepID=A0A518BR78_9BACT|nr:hypothetical protein Pla133_46020 [Planctomycetes bacterium Pla133]QDV03808.1 hypothetical protein Pla86_46000 [Planctomycetes bacterium Pla86]
MKQSTVKQLHDAAAARGDLTYLDPETGLAVLTRVFLRRRGYCCGRGCRHCPYHDEEASDEERQRPPVRPPKRNAG